MSVSIARSLWLFPAITSLFNFNPMDRSAKNDPPLIVSEIREGYDFIVIGAGTAGCVIANRLSEDPTVNVLLLEAGGPEPYEAQIPAVAPYLQLTELDWKFQTESSSKYCLAMKDNKCNLPRGKVLGGSSSLNYMLYVRGNSKDYDQWEAFGNPGWNFQNVLPYFKKSENNKDASIVKDGRYHGIGGYQTIKEAPWRTPLAAAFVDAGRELNFSIIDVNAETQTGFMIPQGYQHKGARSSASKAFLHPIRERTNLDILLDAAVTKVLLNKDNRVYGVLYERFNEIHTVKVSKEVILSAGAFGSPQILMLSGIGPETHLRSLGLTPIVNLPVGRNLQDHVAVGVTFSIDQSISITRSTLECFTTGYQYSLFGSGPLTTFGGVEGIGFVNTKYANGSADWPDIEFHFLSGSHASDNGAYLPQTLNLKDEYWHDYLSTLANTDTFTVIAKLMRPASRGYVELRSLNPNDKPKIVTNYFSEAIDLLVLREGAKIAKVVGETNAFKKFGSKHFDRPLPGCEKFGSHTDKYWECYLRHLTLTIYHYSGTAKMGPYWDPGAVVDPSLRVYGTSGLRVADAAIFPTIPTGNTNAAILMIGEKVSDMIKDYWTSAPEATASRERLSGESADNFQKKSLPLDKLEDQKFFEGKISNKKKSTSLMKVSLHQIKKRSLEMHDETDEEDRIKIKGDKNIEDKSKSDKMKNIEDDILSLSTSFISYISKSIKLDALNDSSVLDRKSKEPEDRGEPLAVIEAQPNSILKNGSNQEFKVFQAIYNRFSSGEKFKSFENKSDDEVVTNRAAGVAITKLAADEVITNKSDGEVITNRTEGDVFTNRTESIADIAFFNKVNLNYQSEAVVEIGVNATEFRFATNISDNIDMLNTNKEIENRPMFFNPRFKIVGDKMKDENAAIAEISAVIEDATDALINNTESVTFRVDL